MTAHHELDFIALDLNAIVADNIKALAARRGETQVSLGKKLGLSSAAMSQKYRGLRQWTINDVARVAVILDVAPWSLFEPVQYEKGPNLKEVGADLPVQYTARDSNPEPTGSVFAEVVDLNRWLTRAA